MRKYKVLRESHREPKATVGTIIYGFWYYDDGLASFYTSKTGEKHKAFTLNPEGHRPFFVMPVTDVEEL